MVYRQKLTDQQVTTFPLPPQNQPLPFVDGIMVAIVAGTFVYVGATEVIPEEWETSEHKWPKFAALMMGIIRILLVTQLTHSFSH